MPVNYAPFLTPFPEQQQGLAPVILALRQERLARDKMAQDAALQREALEAQLELGRQRAKALADQRAAGADRMAQHNIDRLLTEYRNALVVGDTARQEGIREELGGSGVWTAEPRNERPPVMEPFLPVAPPAAVQQPQSQQVDAVIDPERPWRQYGLVTGGDPNKIVENARKLANILAEKRAQADEPEPRQREDEERARAEHMAEQYRIQREYEQRAGKPIMVFRDMFGREFRFDPNAISGARESDIETIANIYREQGFSDEAAREGAAVYARTGDAKLAANAVRARQARDEERAARVETREDVQRHDTWKTKFLEAGRNRRAERAAIANAQRFSAYADRHTMSMVRSVTNDIRRDYGVDDANAVIARSDEIVALTKSDDAMSHRAALGAVGKTIYDERLSNDERRTLEEAVGKWTKFEAKAKEYLDKGRLPDDMLQQIANVADLARKFALKRKQKAAIAARNAVLGMPLNFPDDERREEAADWAYMSTIGSTPKKPRNIDTGARQGVTTSTSVRTGGIDATARARALLQEHGGK